MRYAHDTTLHLTRDEALTLAGRLIEQAKGDGVIHLNIEMKYPDPPFRDDYRMGINCGGVATVYPDVVWAEVAGHNVVDKLAGGED